MGTRKLWPLCRKTLIFERKKGIKTLKRVFFKKMKKVYLRNDEMLIVCKFHPNLSKIVACSRVYTQTHRHTEISEPLTKQKIEKLKKLKKLTKLKKEKQSVRPSLVHLNLIFALTKYLE